MLHLHPAFAYPIFTVWIALIWLAVYAAFPQTRGPQLWMSGWGLAGGPIMNAVYGTDFWRPSQLIAFVPIESAVFGAGFLGVVTAFTLAMPGSWLYQEKQQSIRCSTKVWTLITTVLVAVAVHQLGFNSVFATAAGLVFGASMMLITRRDLWRAMFTGVCAALVAYAVMVGGFVFLIAGNAHELGRELSMFYAVRGAGGTAIMLTVWTIAFGAFFGPFYLWWRNLEFY